MKKIFSGMNAVIILVSLFIVIATIVYLSNSDGGSSGWQIVMNQTGNEWFWMIFASIVSGVVVWAYTKFYKKTQDTKSIVPFAVAFALFFSIAFGKGCTDKANGGVTSGKGRPGGAAKVDSSRVPAEDLLPKK